MGVADLHRTVQLFDRQKTMAAGSTTKSQELEKLENSSSSSSVTLPLPAEMADHKPIDDIEKVATHQTQAPGVVAKPVMTALDWTGPEDPENPENWPTGKKAYHIAYIGLQCFVM